MRPTASVSSRTLGRVTAFLHELGPGLAFVGRHVPLRVARTDYVLDLLFSHLELRRFVVIELAGPATPEAIGKLGFYLAVVDEHHRQIKHGDAGRTVDAGTASSA